MATQIVRVPEKQTLASRFADKFEIDPANVLSIVAATIFKQGKDEAPLTADEVHAAMLVCNQYDLNPFLKEIYAFRSKGKLLIYVSVDGWCKIINRQEQLDGIEFADSFDEKTGKVSAITCRIFRKDRRLPIVVTEYLVECIRDTDPWKKSPIRMLRHRSLIQCSRVAFSISGVLDEEDAERIQGDPVPLGTPNGPMIEGGKATGAGDTSAEETVGSEGGTQFYKTWKAHGHTKEEAQKYLSDTFQIGAPHNDKDSRSIPKARFEEAKKWASTKAPVRVEADKLLEDLGWTTEEKAKFVEEQKWNWPAIVEALKTEINKRNAQESGGPGLDKF